jgi:hypothetical protein
MGEKNFNSSGKTSFPQRLKPRGSGGLTDRLKPIPFKAWRLDECVRSPPEMKEKAQLFRSDWFSAVSF